MQARPGGLMDLGIPLQSLYGESCTQGVGFIPLHASIGWQLHLRIIASYLTRLCSGLASSASITQLVGCKAVWVCAPLFVDQGATPESDTGTSALICIVFFRLLSLGVITADHLSGHKVNPLILHFQLIVKDPHIQMSASASIKYCTTLTVARNLGTYLMSVPDFRAETII